MHDRWVANRDVVVGHQHDAPILSVSLKHICSQHLKIEIVACFWPFDAEEENHVSVCSFVCMLWLFWLCCCVLFFSQCRHLFGNKSLKVLWSGFVCLWIPFSHPVWCQLAKSLWTPGGVSLKHVLLWTLPVFGHFSCWLGLGGAWTDVLQLTRHVLCLSMESRLSIHSTASFGSLFAFQLTTLFLTCLTKVQKKLQACQKGVCSANLVSEVHCCNSLTRVSERLGLFRFKTNIASKTSSKNHIVFLGAAAHA